MRSIHVCGGILALCLATNTAAAAANIQLGDAGDGPLSSSGTRNCVANGDKVVPGQTFPITIRGQSRDQQYHDGTIRIDEVPTRAPARFLNFALGSGNVRPTFVFTPSMDKLSCRYPPSGQFQTPMIQVKASTPEAIYWIDFVAKDVSGAEDTHYPSCLVSVVRELPDVQAVSLVYDPPVPGRSDRTIRLTIRNNAQSAAPLAAVPWSISIGRKPVVGFGGYDIYRPIRTDVKTNVAPGATFTVTAVDSTSAWPGESWDVVGSVDPQLTLGENADRLANNTLRMRRQPPQRVMPAAQETQELDYMRALNNGAHFNHNISSGTQFCSQIGVFQWEHGVVFRLDCPLGGTAQPEAYKDFRLKHGWRIKSIGIKNIRESDSGSFAGQPYGHTSFDWLVTPSTIDSPYMKVQINGEKAAYLEVGVSVVIEGTAGTDPYADNPCPNDCSPIGSMCLKNLPDQNQKGMWIGPIWIPYPFDPRSAALSQCNADDDCANGYACDGKLCRQICRN
jgi:hypothetical protein